MDMKLGQILANALDRAIEPEHKPPVRHFKFLNTKKANREIERLETALGVPPSQPTFSIAKANRRIADLETALAERDAAPQAAAVVATPPAEATSAPGTEHTDQLVSMIRVADPTGSLTFEDWPEDKLKAHAEKVLFQAHLRADFMRPDAELAEVYWRSEKAAGIGRYLRAAKRDAVAKILNPQTKTK